MIGTTLNQRFSLDKELGRGGMGSVYRATDLVLQRPVAIKVLKDRTGEEVGRRIRLEAQILARLVHEHIVRIYDFGEADGLYYFVMEEVDGPSFFRRARTLELPGKLAVIAQVADALDYAHHQGVIHRDVKPANVLMTRSDSARLSDFGLSVLMDVGDDPGVIRGTPSYMSPEQAKGRKLDHRTDLYSLGVMLYEAATGTVPFSGPSMAVMASHAGADPDPPRSRNPAISAGLEALILQLLCKSPEARPASGAATAELIRGLLATDPGLSPGASPPSRRLPGPATADGMPTVATIVAPADWAASDGPASAGPEWTVGASMTRASAPPPGVVPAPPPEATALPGARGLAARMLAEVQADPIIVSPEERYLIGHYLAYLLGGSRRRGLLLRRPHDPINADRGLLLLAMAWLMLKGATEANLKLAAELLDGRPEVRPSITPMVVSKYLRSRDTVGKRREFRSVRRKLQEASPYARDHLTDDRGVLNPGLIPQVLDDLRKIAPPRDEVDDQLVERWNRVADVWRDRPDFRQAILRYATTNAHRDPAGVGLWPEVVYPLIERARWQRQLRSRPEVVFDQILGLLRIPEPGNRVERAIRTIVPARVVEQLDADLEAFVDDSDLDPFGEPADPTDRLSLQAGASSMSELAADIAPERGTVRLAGPDPIRLTLGELRTLWEEGVAGLRTPGKGGHRHVPIGPYRLAVVPSTRGRSAGEVAIQGMRNAKQIEMLTPSLRLAGSSGKPILAIWVYVDGSLTIAYVDFRNATRYILWHAPTAHHNNYEHPAELNSALLGLGLQAPDGLGLALTKRFRPRNPA